jgi:hypothetical protein
LDPAPLQSSSPLPNRRPLDRTRLPWVSAPFDDVVRPSPVESRPSLAHLGSALRLSQPLSGFLATSNFAALSHAAAARRQLLQSVPLAGIVVRLSTPPAPRPFSTGVLERAARRLPPGFTDHHTRAQQPGSPVGSSSLSTHPKVRFPSARTTRDGTVPFRQLRRLRSLAPPANPFRRPRVFHHGRRPILSWSLPLQSTTPRTSGPVTRPGLTT